MNLLKVIPPKVIKSKLPRDAISLNRVISQKVKKKENLFLLSFNEKQSMKLGDFKVRSTELFKDIENSSIAEKEDRFWQNMTERSENGINSATPMYAIDNDFTLFDNQTKHGNLSKFSYADSIIHPVSFHIFCDIVIFCAKIKVCVPIIAYIFLCYPLSSVVKITSR